MPKAPGAVLAVADSRNGILIGARRRKACIVGAGASRDSAQNYMDDPTWEVWALNAVCPVDKSGRARADRWFDLHQRHAQSADDLRWMAECPVPLYVPDDCLDAGPNTLRYPLAEIEEKFGRYWACTFAYQIALALYEDMTDIALCGVDLHYGDDRERTVELACVSWWMGYAEAKGVDIYLPPGSMLGNHRHRYGLEYDAEKQHVEQYVRVVQLVDMQRSFATLKAEFIAKEPAGPTETDPADDLIESEMPVGIGG